MGFSQLAHWSMVSGDIPSPVGRPDMLVFFILYIYFFFYKYLFLRRSGHLAGDDPNNPTRPERAE